jgi:uncharacterized alpha-E superfamily protein
MVRHDGYPFFDMTVFLEPTRMRIVTARKRHSNSSNGQTETSLSVLTEGEGINYYRVETTGQIFANEAEVSEMLLRPLLEFINP